MEKRFRELLELLDMELSKEQYNLFVKYYEYLIEWNEKINLTAITEFEDVFIKHFYDSICLVKGIKINNQELLDVGSGAGFPSIPLKIMFPDLKVTIIDALNKRIRFLDGLTKVLGIEVKLIHGRAEEFPRKHCYDLVTARAVANLQILSELCIPFVKVNGFFIAMKASKSDIELKDSLSAFEILGGQLLKDVVYRVSDQERHLLVVQKVEKSSPKYPRKFNQIKSNPL